MTFRFLIWRLGQLLPQVQPWLTYGHRPLRGRKTAVAAQLQLRHPRMTGNHQDGAQVWLGWGRETKKFRQVGRILFPLPLHLLCHIHPAIYKNLNITLTVRGKCWVKDMEVSLGGLVQMGPKCGETEPSWKEHQIHQKEQNLGPGHYILPQGILYQSFYAKKIVLSGARFKERQQASMS